MRSIVSAIDAAAARWRDAGFPARVRALDAVSARTGYSLPAVEYAFDRLFGTLRRDAIEAVIADELGCLEVLDEFVDRPGLPRARAFPVGRLCVVSSRTTIGVAIVPAIFALCAKCDVLVKDREDHLVAAFFATLTAELPELGDAAAAQTWQSDDDAADLGGFDTVVAFGNDATLAAIAAKLQYPQRLIGFGSKASAGYIASGALAGERAARALARGAALDLVLYETEGCLSMHALFVERGGRVSADRFAELFVEAIRAVAQEFAPAHRDAAGAARVASARDLAMFRDNGASVHSVPVAEYLVVVDPPFEEPPFFLPRAIALRSVEYPAQAAEYLERHSIELEALAIAGDSSELMELAARTKAARLTVFGALQAPPLGTFHGGRPRIAEFVRWITDET